MRIFEVTNPEEQLGLLKLIIDNTWTAIQQQADEQRARDATKKLQSKLKPSRQVTPILRPKQVAPSIPVSPDGKAGDLDKEEDAEVDGDKVSKVNDDQADIADLDSDEVNDQEN